MFTIGYFPVNWPTEGGGGGGEMDPALVADVASLKTWRDTIVGIRYRTSAAAWQELDDTVARAIRRSEVQDGIFKPSSGQPGDEVYDNQLLLNQGQGFALVSSVGDARYAPKSLANTVILHTDKLALLDSLSPSYIVVNQYDIQGEITVGPVTPYATYVVLPVTATAGYSYTVLRLDTSLQTSNSYVIEVLNPGITGYVNVRLATVAPDVLFLRGSTLLNENGWAHTTIAPRHAVRYRYIPNIIDSKGGFFEEDIAADESLNVVPPPTLADTATPLPEMAPDEPPLTEP